MDAGYSGKPLAQKLGLKPGMRSVFVDAPDGYVAGFEESGIVLLSGLSQDMQFVQLFSLQREKLRMLLPSVIPLLTRDGMVWVSWPKKTAANKMLAQLTDITEDTIREIALPMGLVDVKVCAIDDTWSGLKLVIRKELR